MRILRSVVLIALSLGITTPLLGASSAHALEQGSIGALSPQHTTIQKSFGPIPGVYPQNPAAEPYLAFRPQTCSTVTYCDTFELDVHYPVSFLKNVFFGITVTLDWKNPQTKKNPTGNHVTMLLWPDNTGTGAPSSDCKTPEDTKCANLPSQTITVTEPDDTSRNGSNGNPPTPMYFTVVNVTGVNTGYTITAKWFTFDLPPPPAFKAKQLAVTGNPTPSVSGPSAPQPTLPPIVGGPTTTRKILVPGPDGKLHAITIPAYAAGAKLTAADTKPRSPWIPAFIAGAIVLVGLSAYLIYRARQQDRAANEF
jgi:hypothetical protein